MLVKKLRIYKIINPREDIGQNQFGMYTIKLKII